MSRPRATPGAATRTHPITLSDGKVTYGLKLAGGMQALQETPVTPSTLFLSGGGTRWGDFDPSMAHIEQRTWNGGRGNEDFYKDNSQFFDSRCMWTMTEERAYPAPQQKISTGFRNQDMSLPGNVSWRALYGSKLYIAKSFSASANYDADKVQLWIRRRGAPATLNIALMSDSGGSPNAVLKSSTVTTSTITDSVSEFYTFDWTGTTTLVSGTTYWVVAYGDATDSKTSHWEIGGNASGTAGKESSNGSAWTVTEFEIYYRVTDADVERKWKFFIYKSSLYAVDRKDDGITASKLYICSGTTWTEKTTTGLGVVTDVCVSNDTVFFAQGESTNIRKMNFDGATTWAYADDGTNKATFLYAFNDPTIGPVVWRANNGTTTVTISRANAVSWSTNLTFGTAIYIGDAAYPITSLVDYNNALWVMKQDSVWVVSNDRPSRLNIGIDDAPSANNGLTSIAHSSFMFFSFLTSLERLYGTTVDDIGPWRGAGLPSERSGVVSAAESVISMLFLSIDAGASGSSSILVYDGINYHEIFRAPKTGARIRGLKWQPIASVGAKLWIDCGNDIYYMTFPLDSLHPLRDSSMVYQHEGVLITSTYDMGVARLPKLFKEMTAITQNLGANAEIFVDYQIDDDIGTSTWTEADRLLTSPADTVEVGIGEAYSIRFRFRANTNVATTPPIIKATVLEGVARTPVKYQYTMRIQTSSNQMTETGAPDVDPDELLNWLKAASVKASVITMYSTLQELNDKKVFIEPPSIWRQFENALLKIWGGQLVITVREI